MKDRTKPEVEAKIGGEKVRIRFDKRALFRLGDPQHVGALGAVDVTNEAALFRRACIWAFCLLVDRSKFASAEDVADGLENGELEELMNSVNEAIEAGRAQEKGEAADPLSGNGPSPGGASV